MKLPFELTLKENDHEILHFTFVTTDEESDPEKCIMSVNRHYAMELVGKEIVGTIMKRAHILQCDKD